MKKWRQLIAILLVVVSIFVLSACSGGSSSSSSKRNGYDMPKSGESFSDYVQRVDPGLYNSMNDRYESAKKNGW